MFTEVKLSQSKNALHPRLVTELGIVIDFRLLHPAKAISAMLSTEFGIVTEVRL